MLKKNMNSSMAAWCDTSRPAPNVQTLTIDDVVASFKADYSKLSRMDLTEPKEREIDAIVCELKAHHGKQFKCGGVGRKMAWV